MAVRSILAILCSLLFVGCPRPGCPTTPHEDPSTALRMHRSLHRTLGSMRAEARVDQRGSEGRVRGTVLLFLQRPDRVRFDAMTQFGPAAVLTSNGNAFQLLDMREDRFLEGEACPSNIARLLGVALGGEEVARFLVGDSPRLDTDQISMACGDEGYVITLTTEHQRQEIVLAVRGADHELPPEAQHLRLVRSELFTAAGDTVWRATFEDYQVVTDPADEEGRGIAMPFRVRFEDPGREADTLVRFKSIEIVTDPPRPEVFQQDAPPGVTVEHVMCD